MTIEQAFQIALQHHKAGEVSLAGKLYREILVQQPKHVESLHHLGVIAGQVGRIDIAVDLIRQAIALQPDHAEAYSNLGSVLREMGQLDEAVAAGRRAVSLNPNYAEAYNNLGTTLGNMGNGEEAAAAYRRAIELKPEYAEAYYNLGTIMLRNKSQLEAAIAAYRQAIALRPHYAQAHNNLGNALKDKGQLDEAIDAYRQAVAVKPDYVEAHRNLGFALRDKGQLDQALSAYRQAIALNPNIPETHDDLGNALKANGQLDEAIAAHRQAILLNPNYAQAYNNLGNSLSEKGQLDQAIAAYRQAIILNSRMSEAHNNLGNALRDKNQLNEAIAAARQAIALKPDYPQAYNNLGNALRDKGQVEQSIAAYRQAIALKSDYAQAYSNLGNALMDQGRSDEAIALHRRAIILSPDYPQAYNNLGNALRDQGQLDESIAAYRQAIALKPGYSVAHSNLLFATHFHPGLDALAIVHEHSCWNRLHAEPLKKFIQPHLNDRDLNRRLRIGYVSQDLREHPIGRFMLPLLAHHNKTQVEVFAYSRESVADVVTERLRNCIDGWRDIAGVSDDQTTDLIRQDKIDILVDLTMHMANNRMLLFARKPAPVQVTYLAYCASTGLKTIGYRLSDPYLDPVGQDESIYSEKTIRLPDTYWCYEPIIITPQASSVPALEKGFVTFGSLNNFCKVSEQVMAAWVELLQSVPNSQLLLHAHDGSHRQRVRDRLKQAGIEPQRVRFAGLIPIKEYFDLYRQIDIAVDTFPYAGGTTSCDALWMGVPVVSLAGKTAVGRGGLSILSNIGFPELVAHSKEEYVRIAVELAHDLPRLSNLHSTLRKRMEESPLMNAPRFARNIEAAYRQMWRTWCET